MSDSLRASVQGLELIDRLRKQRGWNRQSPLWYQSALTTLPTLKRFLEGEPIKRETFISICQAVGGQWQDVVDRTTSADFPRKEWEGVPDVSVFYGRTAELSQLHRWISGGSLVDRQPSGCRLVALLGMGGIGKTALAAKLAEQIQDQFSHLIWRSLRYPPPLSQLLNGLIGFLANPELPPPDSLDDKISVLIDRLKQHRVLLVLDNLEALLSSGHLAGRYRSDYQDYGELLRRLGQEPHQSCVLLTSREKTPEIALLEDGTLPVRTLCLDGLGEAAQEILRAKHLSGESQWKTLIQIYRGNPLVLKIVSTSIKELFDGDVSAFLKQSMTLITGDLSRFIDQQFVRLSPLEQQVACQLARLKEPVSLTQLQQRSQPTPPHDLLKALESLGRRSLIEKSTAGFTLQPAVLEYVSHQVMSAQEDLA